MKQFFLKSSLDESQIGIDLWGEAENAKACVQISHGMAEHPDRYDRFARFLNERGYVVAANDHRGHRRGAVNGERGMAYGDSWNQTLSDMHDLWTHLKEAYGLPVFLIGHSYGSFLAQRYFEMHSSELAGVILSGTAHMKNALIAAGKAIAGLQKALCGGQKPGRFINKLSFGSYNKKFADQGQEFAWLSRDREQVRKYEEDPDCGYVLCLDYYYYFFRGALRLYGPDLDTVRKDFPIMIACGSDDPVSNYSKTAKKLYDLYRAKGLEPTLKIYDGARHEVLNELNKDDVYADFLAFVDKAIGQGE